MKDVQQFIEEFAKTEAETGNLKRIPELEPYNKSVEKFYTYYIDSLNGSMGVMKKEKLDDLYMYEIYKGYPPVNPRHLFKISKYTHKEYGDVWLAYMSRQNPDYNLAKNLKEVFFIIKDKEKLKIAKSFDYSKLEFDDDKEDFKKGDYKWHEGKGLKDLTFETLEGPVEIERYLEPDDISESLKLYNDNI